MASPGIPCNVIGPLSDTNPLPNPLTHPRPAVEGTIMTTYLPCFMIGPLSDTSPAMEQDTFFCKTEPAEPAEPAEAIHGILDVPDSRIPHTAAAPKASRLAEIFNARAETKDMALMTSSHTPTEKYNEFERGYFEALKSTPSANTTGLSPSPKQATALSGAAAVFNPTSKPSAGTQASGGSDMINGLIETYYQKFANQGVSFDMSFITKAQEKVHEGLVEYVKGNISRSRRTTFSVRDRTTKNKNTPLPLDHSTENEFKIYFEGDNTPPQLDHPTENELKIYLKGDNVPARDKTFIKFEIGVRDDEDSSVPTPSEMTEYESFLNQGSSSGIIPDVTNCGSRRDSYIVRAVHPLAYRKRVTDERVAKAREELLHDEKPRPQPATVSDVYNENYRTWTFNKTHFNNWILKTKMNYLTKVPVHLNVHIPSGYAAALVSESNTNTTSHAGDLPNGKGKGKATDADESIPTDDYVCRLSKFIDQYPDFTYNVKKLQVNLIFPTDPSSTPIEEQIHLAPVSGPNFNSACFKAVKRLVTYINEKFRSINALVILLRVPSNGRMPFTLPQLYHVLPFYDLRFKDWIIKYQQGNLQEIIVEGWPISKLDRERGRYLNKRAKDYKEWYNSEAQCKERAELEEKLKARAEEKEKQRARAEKANVKSCVCFAGQENRWRRFH